MLKSHTKYTLDLNDQSPRVKWLWEILNEITDEDKIKFIKFCWAQERLPATNEEYEKLQVQFEYLNYKGDGGTSFYKKEIIDKVISFLDLQNIKYKNLISEEINKLL